jgi:hypothetical protein
MTWADHDTAMRPVAQHILALAVRDFLASHDARGRPGEGVCGIKCYAQDPIYTPIDEQVLGEAGFDVVDDPKAFLEVDESSVVIAIAPDIPVRQIVADIARPAMMIWDKFSVTDTDRFAQLPLPSHCQRGRRSNRDSSQYRPRFAACKSNVGRVHRVAVPG